VVLTVLAACGHLSYNASYFTYVPPLPVRTFFGAGKFLLWGLNLLSAALMETHVKVVSNFVKVVL
jgi:hypothetical protein